MKKILIIITFISLFFINNISAKAYWEIEVGWESITLGHIINKDNCDWDGGTLKEISYKFLNLVSNNAEVCYFKPKLIQNPNYQDTRLNTCVFPDYFDNLDNYKEMGETGCPDGYFYIKWENSRNPGDALTQNFGPNYQNRCIPCGNFNQFIGSEKTYNGKKCYITGQSVEAAPGLDCQVNYKSLGFYCGKGNAGFKIGVGDNGFRTSIEYITPAKIDGFEQGKAVCPEGYLFSDGYCYECKPRESGNNSELSCATFKQITAPIWKAIRIIAPILAVVLGALDFLKATAASDEKEMKKATNNFVKRIIMLALLFLLTYIVNFIVGLVNGVDLGNIFECL